MRANCQRIIAEAIRASRPKENRTFPVTHWISRTLIRLRQTDRVKKSLVSNLPDNTDARVERKAVLVNERVCWLFANDAHCSTISTRAQSATKPADCVTTGFPWKIRLCYRGDFRAAQVAKIAAS